MTLRVEIDDFHSDDITVHVSPDGPVWTMSPRTASNLRSAIQWAEARRLEEQEWEWDDHASS